MSMNSISSDNLSLIINSIVFIGSVIFSILILWRIKLVGKGYKLLFVMYTIFWIPLMLLRENTGTMQNSISSNSSILWLPLAAYGIIGVFARPFADYIAYKTYSRKTFIYLAIFLQIATYIPIIAHPCTTTNVIQSIGVGLGASCIGSYQLLFNEQHSEKKFFLTISFLALPPLLADFISSPITSIFRIIANINDNQKPNPEILKYWWLVGLFFVLIVALLSFFIKEERSLVFKNNKSQKRIQGSTNWWYFILTCCLGTLIAFIKFSNSGSIAVLHIQTLAGGQSHSKSYEGYLSLLFTVGQLISSAFTGMVLLRRCNQLVSYTIGALVWVLYQILMGFTTNPYLYLGVHVINGIAYGILYNLILGYVLNQCFKTKKITPMGVYQGLLSLGIATSTSFVTWLKDQLKIDYMRICKILSVILISLIFISWCINLGCYLLDKKIEPKLPSNNKVISRK